MKKLSDKKIYAIQQVITVNRDIMELLVKRGVSWDDIMQLCRQAQLGGGK